MRISLVCRQGVLGLEPVAAFKNWEDADEFCSCSDLNWETGTDSDLSIQSFTLDEYVGMAIEDVNDPELQGADRDDDEDDEDYDD